MRQNLPNPLLFAGFLLMAFAASLLMEALCWSILAEGVLGVLIGTAGWLIWRRGMRQRVDVRYWLRSLVLGLLLAALLYPVSYFLLMDRSRPAPDPVDGRFESSLRFASSSPVETSVGLGPGRVTILNYIFRPADRWYVRRFPRSDAEMEWMLQNRLIR